MTDDITYWSQHNCERYHRTTRAFIKCALPRIAWVSGEGEYALLARCGGPSRSSVTLHPTLESAREAKASIDRNGCGNQCRGRGRGHRIVRVVLQVRPTYPKS